MPKDLVFKRKIYSKMLEWKNSPVHNSALLIEGARRIGKSTIVEEFAKNEFGQNFIIIDFRKESSDVKNMFNDIGNLDSFFQKFFLFKNKVLQKGGLIVFDEVQFCPKAREAIKDFVKDGRYYYIETGSLITIMSNTQNIMIPSEERRIDMYPMDFEEFLWAYEKNDAYRTFSDIIRQHKSIPEALHNEYLKKFRTYMLLGGMPKVISIFLQTNSFFLADEEKLDILKLYRDDLRKYDEKYKTSCELIFNTIPEQLAKENKRFVISKLKAKKRYEQIQKSLNDLCDFKIVNRISSISTLESPISLHRDEDKFKLYFCDTGLLFSMLIKVSKEKMQEVYSAFINGKKVLNMGSIFESIAIQQLVLGGLNIYYHKYTLVDKTTGKGKTYELDLVAELDFKVSVIEVKSSKNYTTTSLDTLKSKYPHLKPSRYVFGIKNIKFASDKTTLPIYLLLLSV